MLARGGPPPRPCPRSRQGRQSCDGPCKTKDLPAIIGIGGSLIYFTDADGSDPTSPCGRIRIPTNEDRGTKGQIVEYLRRYSGEGIQHIAVRTEDIFTTTDTIAERGLKIMPVPPKARYDMSHARVTGHTEPLDRMMKHGILIDGEDVGDGGEAKSLLQIFSQTVIGPIFVEFIQLKGDDGVGEGDFKALFEPIERDRIERGVLVAE